MKYLLTFSLLILAACNNKTEMDTIVIHTNGVFNVDDLVEVREIFNNYPEVTAICFKGINYSRKPKTPHTDDQQ